MSEKFDTRIEQELKRALQREDAPAGFTERVLAKVREQEARKEPWWTFMHRPAFRFASTAAVFVLMIGGVAEYRRYEQEREAGQAAKRQLMEALRVTGAKLHYAQQKVNEVEAQQ